MIRKILGALALFAVLTVAACGSNDDGSPKITPAEGVLAGCSAFGTLVGQLAPLRADGTLSAGLVGVVDRTRASVDPVCKGAAPDVDSSTGAVIVNQGVAVMQAVLAQVLLK
jgi:hypothetical protein